MYFIVLIVSVYFMHVLYFMLHLNFLFLHLCCTWTDGCCLFKYAFRRGLRLKSKKPSDTADTPPAEAVEEEEDNKGEEDERESKEEEKRNEGEVEEQVDTDDCEVCPGTEAPPFLWTAWTIGGCCHCGEIYLFQKGHCVSLTTETQLSDNDDDRTQDLIMVTDSGAEVSSCAEFQKRSMWSAVGAPERLLLKFLSLFYNWTNLKGILLGLTQHLGIFLKQWQLQREKNKLIRSVLIKLNFRTSQCWKAVFLGLPVLFILGVHFTICTLLCLLYSVDA